MDPLWSGWDPIIKSLIVGPLGYVGVVVMLRSSGKRSLSKLNMFDFVITIAMGSILASMFMGSQALIPSILSFGLLLLCQMATAYSTSRSDFAQKLLMASATVLYKDGTFATRDIRRHRLTEDELASAVRDSSCGDFKRVAAIVLETDGTLSVIPKDQAGDQSLVDDLQR
jgi:uncharacterized membrane protein YcaP (DUF421 family)